MVRLPAGMKLYPYWRACLGDLHRSYNGICAYLSVFVERVTGGATADHFVPKSRALDLAYEWSNYRLSCSRMNARKRDFESVLDPFSLDPGTFRLELVTGRIYPNSALSPVLLQRARETIDRLDLDDWECREMRARRYEEYRRGVFTAAFLERYSPFIFDEARRQGLL